MIEAALQEAVQLLPQPKSDFHLIEARCRDRQSKSRNKFPKRRKLAAVFACIVLLLGCTTAAATTHTSYGAWATSSKSYADVKRISKKLGIIIPDHLSDSPFYSLTTMHVVPEGISFLEAIFSSSYRWYGIDFGYQEVVPAQGASGTAMHTDYSLSLGRTDNELWKYCFDLDDNGNWPLNGTLPGSYQVTEYEGCTLQMGTRILEGDCLTDRYHHRVIWTDPTSQTVFSLRKSTSTEQFPQELLTLSKNIIDLNVAALSENT